MITPDTPSDPRPASIRASRPTSPGGFAIAWDQALERAHNYWAPPDADTSVECAEILVGGPVVIDQQPVRLIPSMRDRGVIA